MKDIVLPNDSPEQIKQRARELLGVMRQHGIATAAVSYDVDEKGLRAEWEPYRMQDGSEVVSLPAPVRAADGGEEDLADALAPALLALTRLLCPADHLHVEVSGTLFLLPVGEGGELRVWSVWEDGRTFWYTAVLAKGMAGGEDADGGGFSG